MSHQLDETYDSPMISVKETPWHQKGTVIQFPPHSVQNLLEQCPAIGFEVETRPIFFEKDHEGESWNPDSIPFSKVIVRKDTEKPLGIVGNRYQCHQVTDGLAALEPLMVRGLATVETAGALRDGKTIWVMVRFTTDSDLWKQMTEITGEVKPYGIVRLDHTGKASSKVFNTVVRVVCANTDAYALSKDGKGAVNVPHVGNVKEKFTEASETLYGDILNGFDRLAERNLTLSNIFPSVVQFEELVLDEVAIVPTDKDKFSSDGYFQGAVKRAKARRHEVERLWSEGASHKTHSAYEAVQGLIEALDHNEHGVFPNPKHGALDSLLAGKAATLKQRVTNNLLALA